MPKTLYNCNNYFSTLEYLKWRNFGAHSSWRKKKVFEAFWYFSRVFLFTLECKFLIWVKRAKFSPKINLIKIYPLKLVFRSNHHYCNQIKNVEFGRFNCKLHSYAWVMPLQCHKLIASIKLNTSRDNFSSFFSQ